MTAAGVSGWGAALGPPEDFGALLRATVTPTGLRPGFVPAAGVEALDLDALRHLMVAQGGDLGMRRRRREFNGAEPELVSEAGTEGPFTRVMFGLDRV
ncbi:MAG: hypothetical protein OXH70_16330 [Acidobacteria bacterium]|nr:hypothetical protein [Acidobacteriota bacterium]